MLEDIWYYQAEESMENGDYVICDEDPHLRKIREGELPIGRVKLTFKHNVETGERVGVKSIWYNGRLREILRIGDYMFVRGDLKTEIKKTLGLYKTKTVKCSKCGGKGEYEEEI